jgi:hypothetical protein
MEQKNYSYGQGMLKSPGSLFFTPKKLSPADYVISLKLDVESNIYSGVETIRWRNESHLPVKKLCIHKGRIAENNLIIEEINGLSPDKSRLTYHNDLILIDLNEPINQGGVFEIKLKFSGEIPKSFYHGGDIREFSRYYAWYPKLYWDERICADCKIIFESVTEGYQIFAAGEKNGNVYTEKNVANYYGFAVSSKMTSLSSQVRGINVEVVHYPEYKDCAKFILDKALDALDFFADFIGFYPYKSFTVLPGSAEYNGGGNFSSGIVFVHNFEKYDPNDRGYMDYYEGLVPHEIGHQYFWESVIENENPGWLGLGLSISLDREYTQFKTGSKHFHRNMIDRYMEYVSQGKNTTLILPEEELIRVFSNEDNEYGTDFNGAVCHGKAFSIMSMLIDIIGKDCYFDVMRHVLKEYAGKVLYTPDFIRTCEEFSGIDLKWFFNQWLKTNKVLSYSLENITETECDGIYTVTAEVLQKEAIAVPVCAAVYFEDGSSQTVLTERLLNEQTLTFTSRSKYTQIIFDPFEVYAMKKFGEEIRDDCAELLIKNIKDTGYTDPYNSSLGYYQRYQKFNINDLWALYLLRMQLFDSRNYSESIQVSEDIIKNPSGARHNTADSYRWIGMCYDVLNERGKAVEAYKKALSYEEVQFGDRHDQYGLHITREWIQERILSPYVR